MIGIDKIGVYPGTLALPLRDLALARGRPPEYPERELLALERSVLAPWEDPVTMAVEAAQAILGDEDRARIELIVVATESAVDHGKAMATYVHEHCAIQPRCRAFEVKQACYGGTAALMMAAHWLRSIGRVDARALVICSDASRAHFGRPWEFILGAGAVAMLIGPDPAVLALELDDRGYWSANVHDTFRPSARDEVGNAEGSLHCYLDALEGAVDALLDRVDAATLAGLAGLVYHVPFGGMTRLAHRAMLRRLGRDASARAARDDFERRVRPGLRFNARIGGVYTGALFLALTGTLATGALAEGDAVGLFAYGSGSTAELLRGRVGPGAAAGIAAPRLERALAARRVLTVGEYEAIEAARRDAVERRDWVPARALCPGHYEAAFAGRRRLVLEGVDEEWVRHYAWS